MNGLHVSIFFSIIENTVDMVYAHYKIFAQKKNSANAEKNINTFFDV